MDDDTLVYYDAVPRNHGAASAMREMLRYMRDNGVHVEECERYINACNTHLMAYDAIGSDLTNSIYRRTDSKPQKKHKPVQLNSYYQRLFVIDVRKIVDKFHTKPRIRAAIGELWRRYEREHRPFEIVKIDKIWLRREQFFEDIEAKAA